MNRVVFTRMLCFNKALIKRVLHIDRALFSKTTLFINRAVFKGAHFLR